MKSEKYLIIGTAFIVAFVIVIVILYLLRKLKLNRYKNEIKKLEIEKNTIASTPISLELSKVEPIIKNDKMEEKYNKWQDKYRNIKENRLPKIDDLLIELDIVLEKRDYKTFLAIASRTELELYKIKSSAERLLEQIKEITLSEEKYRGIVTKLKNRYRTINKNFQDNKNLYGEVAELINLQLENIESKFLDFEKVMEVNDYIEVVHIVKGLEVMINHIDIAVSECPDVLLMASSIIPNRMNEVFLTCKDMTTQGYPLDYLNIDYNIEETNKIINDIMQRVKVLNLENALFELKTILDYYDSLFLDFEKEKLAKKIYIDMESDFRNRLNKTNELVKDIYSQLDDIKNMYDLDDNDIQIIYDVNKILVVINDDYKKLIARNEAKSTPYSVLHFEIVDLSKRLISMEEEFDQAMKSLGNMYDDEERAREQLDEIQEFLKECKKKIRCYKLPVVPRKYFVELNEANDAIEEVVKELRRQPIEIKTLNIRVDTARDLVLKLYNTTNDMVKTAELAEMAIVYGNRYRSVYSDIDVGLQESESMFYKGNYKNSLDKAIKTIQIVEEDIYTKLLKIYDRG